MSKITGKSAGFDPNEKLFGVNCYIITPENCSLALLSKKPLHELFSLLLPPLRNSTYYCKNKDYSRSDNVNIVAPIILIVLPPLLSNLVGE